MKSSRLQRSGSRLLSPLPILLLTVFIMGAANSLLWLFVARTIDGIFGANVSTTQAYVADVTPPEDRSRALGLLGATFGVGFIFGPLIGGVLSQISLSAPFYFAGGLAAVNAVLIFFILPESLPVEEDFRLDRDTFVTLFRQGLGSDLASHGGILFHDDRIFDCDGLFRDLYGRSLRI